MRKDILHQHHADDFIQTVAVYRQARMTMFGKSGDHLVPAGLVGQGDDFSARDRHITGVAFAKMQQIAQHFAFKARQITVGVGGVAILIAVFVDDLFQLLAQAGLGPVAAQNTPQAAPQRAFTFAFSRRFAGAAPIGPQGFGTQVHRPSRKNVAPALLRLFIRVVEAD